MKRRLNEIQLREAQTTEEAFASGDYFREQTISGAIFNSVGVRKEVFEMIDTSVVYSFSSTTEKSVAKMFADGDKENLYSVMAPAITWYGNEILAVLRIWLMQFEYAKRYDSSNQLKNTWQENYLYTIKLNRSYTLSSKGRLIGIPAPSNAQYGYRTDGPMDPRIFNLDNKPYISFHMWKNDKDEPEDPNATDWDVPKLGRIHVWDFEENKIVKLRVKNASLCWVEINWVPVVAKKQLYYIYTLDPLQVLRCDIRNGMCHFLEDYQETKDSYTFQYFRDHLRGGTPFLEYKWPYFIGLAHSTMVTSSPWDSYGIYSAHLVVISVDPFRIVYVSSPIKFNETFLSSVPIARPFAQIKPFVFPVGIILRNLDVIDFGAHLSDSASYIVRMRGVSKLMNSVMSIDSDGRTKAYGPKSLLVNTYVHASVKKEHPNYTFYGEEFFSR